MARTIDVSALPQAIFGSRAPVWWGTVAFMVIEGTTLALCAGSYLYVSRHFASWPPAGTPLPDLLVPTIGFLALLASLVPARAVHRAAERRDLPGLRRILAVSVLLEIGILVLRGFEFGALNVRWDGNAYGSTAWFILGLHSTLLLLDLFETAAFAVLFRRERVEAKHFGDAADVAFYWYFVVATWVPLYLLLYWSPRWL